MASDDENIPKPHEVRAQLKRMLERKFAKSDVLKPIFAFLVEQSILDIPVHSEDIAALAYPSDANGIEKARVAANQIRTLATAYNNVFSDRVIIAFPKTGRGPRAANYKPIFSYAAFSRRYFPYALSEMRQMLPFTLHYSTGQLQVFIQDIRSYKGDPEEILPVFLLLIESLVLLQITDPERPITDHYLPLEMLDIYTAHAQQYAPDHRIVHVVRALHAIAHYDINSASRHFSQAIQLHPEVSEYFGYHAVLFAKGKWKLASECVAQRLKRRGRFNPNAEPPGLLTRPPRHPNHAGSPETDPFEHSIAALWAFGTNNFDGAMQYIWDALRALPEYKLPHLIQALLYLILNSHQSPMSGILSARPQQLTEGYGWDHVTAYDAYEHLWQIERPYRALRICLSGFVKGALLIPPLKSDCHELLDKYKARINEQLTYDQEPIENIYPCAGIQDAFFRMASQEHDAAIDILEGCWRQRNPLIMWLPMIPLFKPLYNHPRFKTLLRHHLYPPPEEPSPA